MNTSLLFLKQRHQRGIVLLLVLIVLVVMTLGGVALMRSVDTANIAAGNLVFKQGAIQATDLGVENVLSKFRTGAIPGPLATVVAREADLVAHGYSAVILATTSQGVPIDLIDLIDQSDPRDIGTFDSTYTNNRIATTNTQEVVRFLIDRQCTVAGAVSAASCNLYSSSATGGSQPAEKTGGGEIPLFRATIRVDGPRNTLSFTQVIFRP